MIRPVTLFGIACLLVAAAGIARSQPVVTETLTPAVWTLYKGTTKQANQYASSDECLAVVRALEGSQKTATTKFECRGSIAIVSTLSPGPQPQGEFQVLSCPAGSAQGSTWQQTRDYVATKTPPFWKATTWTPKTMPNGACPPAPVVHMHSGLPDDPSSLMAFYPGRFGDLLSGDPLNPNPNDLPNSNPNDPPADPSGFNGPTGAFRNVCTPFMMAHIDPIVAPGQEVAHLHTFFGNTGLTKDSTTDQLFTTKAGQTCRGGSINRGVYWVPTVLDWKNGFKAIKPRVMITYYKTAPWTVHSMTQPLPKGLKIIAGDPAATGPTRWGIAGFSCDGFAFASDSDEPFVGGSHVMPTAAQCAPGREMWMGVVYPNCWDGVNLDSPDHKSHMRYGQSPFDADTLPNGCQRSHPVLVPQMANLVLVPIPPGVDPARDWVLASDVYAFDKQPDGSLKRNDKPSGATFHADNWAIWRPEIMDVWLNKCDRASMDCQAHKLGDGRTMDSFDGN